MCPIDLLKQGISKGAADGREVRTLADGLEDSLRARSKDHWVVCTLKNLLVTFSYPLLIALNWIGLIAPIYLEDGGLGYALLLSEC